MTTERHFWNSDRGYWVAIDCAERTRTLIGPDGTETVQVIRPEITAESYGAGTVEVPPRPSPAHTWDGTSWTAPPAPEGET